MSHLALIFSLLFVNLATASELPWIGVSLEFPKAEDRKAVELAEGMGLKVMKVVSGSPLAKAGGQAGDLWWKLDDQMLVNKRQMLVLLRTKSPGDTVKIEYYRGSVMKSLSLVLVSKKSPQVYSISHRPPSLDASHTLAKREQIARVKTDKEELTLKREGPKWRFEVIEQDATVLSSLVTDLDHKERVPPKWHGAFLILKLTLEQQASQPGGESERRVRYVPRSKSREK